MSSSDPALLINQLPVSQIFPADPELLLQVITEVYKRTANAVNTKEASLYDLQELGNFQSYFTSGVPFVYRDVYRRVFDMVSLNGGAIAAGATVSVAHGITGIVAPTCIYGSATNSDVPIKFLPLPYTSATLVTDQIQIYLTATNVVLVNGATQSILTQAYVVAEYVKT